MKIGMIGLAAAAMMVAASAANAGYTWSNLRDTTGSVEQTAKKSTGAVGVTGYTWSNLTGDSSGSKPSKAATRGYTWSNLHGDTGKSKAPVAVVRGYTWSN